MLFMLDSDISISIIRRRPSRLLQRFEAELSADLCISIVSYGELYYGVAKSEFIERNLRVLEEYASRLSVLPWSYDAIREYGPLRAYLDRNGIPIGALDTMIAAHALSLDATIITNNVRHFERVPDLKLENWLAVENDKNKNPERTT